MATKLQEPQFLPRDGTSQKGRVLAALDPAFVRVDERTIQDLVAFAREVGKGLVHHGLDDKPAGSFSRFIGSLDADVVAAFLEAPERFDPATSPALFRPHFTLFLAFLRLFQEAQREINALTQRHLDFYFRRVLRMGRKGPVPDRVHVLFDLARGEREVLVPGGSLVSAGPDSLGREQVYATEHPIVVNRIRIAKKSSVFVERRRTGLADARAPYPTDPRAALLAMWRIALADPLPLYPDHTAVTAAKLDALALRAREDGGFFLTAFEIGDLMRLRALPASDHDREAKMAAILALSGERQAKLGLSPALPSVEDIALYWSDLERYFHLPPESFHEVMRLAGRPDDSAWKRVDALLESAHRAKVRKDRMDRLRDLHTAQPKAGITPLVREVLDDDTASEYNLSSFLKSEQMDALDRALDGADWEAVYSLLEIAQRNRLGERPAQKVEWLDVHPAEDAAAAGARPPLDGQVGSARWATFGLARPSDPGVTPPPVLGWAITSPLLRLGEGAREIRLTLGIRRDGVSAGELGELLLSGPLLFQLSTAKGWLDCPAAAVEVDSYAALSGTSPGDDPLGIRFTLKLDAAAAPVAPLPPPLAAAGESEPVLRLMLRPVWSAEEERYRTHYQELASLALVAVHLAVDAAGLRPLRLQSDERTIDPKKPFEPFGAAPAVGSRLLIGHPEISGKRLDTLKLELQWMGVPPSLAAHYANYTLGDGEILVDPGKLTVRLSMIERGEEAWAQAGAPLFGAVPSAPATLAVTVPEETTARPDPAILSSARPDGDVSTWARYLQWELDGSDFGHAVYPAVAAGKALDLAAAIANKTTIVAGDYKVNPPYTPKLKSLSLGYTSSLEVRLDAAPPDPGVARVLHVHPFGACDVHRDLGGKRLSAGVPLLPPHDDDGELYLGLAGVEPPQSVSLLFQLAEGSADPDLPPQRVEWSFLDGDRWVPFAHRLLRDTTHGLISSGLVELALDPAAPSTRLRGDLYWIRAAVARGVASVCDTIDIHPQAVSAVFVDRDNAPDHFRAPLREATIKKLVSRIPGIAAVRQPYTSRGGRPAEDDGMWATRVSERLRHKQRALSMWDHERLVLERFPQIYKARCLPARPDEPGKVEVVVIPDIRNLLPSDPFEPKAPSSLLAEIQEYLRDRTPPFAEVVVRNARYVPVRVRLAVRFAAAGNESFYRRKLEEELNRFLSPWAFEEGSDIVLGGRIYANSVVDFVDRRDYVDYVAGVKLFRGGAGDTWSPAPAPPEGEGAFVAADRPDAVLVAARSHEIVVLQDAVYDETSVSGINFMKVELDFIVA